MKLKPKSKPLLFIALMFIVLSVLLCACSKDEEPSDEDLGSDFSGSLSGGESKDDEPETPKDEGDPDATYRISTAEELLKMKRKGKYVLDADIDLTDVEWTPVGTYEAPFCGSFDGNGHKIIGLTVVKASEDNGISTSFKYSYCGFFGYASGAEIKSVTFENARIDISETAQNRNIYAGIVGGYFSECTVKDVTVSGSVCVISSNHSGYAGGIVGGITKTKAEKCVSLASVKTDRCPVYAESGGLFAVAKDNSSILNSSASGDVYASTTVGLAYSGGLVGYCFTVSVTNSHSSSKVYSEVSSYNINEGKKGAAYSGGLAALASSIAKNSSDDEEKVEVENTCVFLRSYYVGSEVTANGGENAAYSGGLVCKSDYVTFKHCYASTLIKSSSSSDTAYSAGISTVVSEYTKIDGCFFIGSAELEAKEAAYAKFGTLYVSTTTEKDIDLVSSLYRSSGCTINGKFYSCSEENAIAKKLTLNGKACIVGTTFYDSALLSSELGWNVSEWVISESALPTPVIN